MQRAIEQVRAPADGQRSAPAEAGSSSATRRRPWRGARPPAPRQPTPVADQRLADLLADPRGAQALENPEPLRRLLARPTSARLVDMLLEDKAQCHPDDPSLVACLGRRPNLLAVLDRSPRLVDQACAHAGVLEAVLTMKDPSASLVDEPLLHAHVARLHQAVAMNQRTAQDDAGLLQRHRQVQAEWMQALLGKTPPPDGERSITQTISRVDLPGAECFATGCPRKQGDSLPDFLTLAARQNAVIVNLMAPEDFDKPRYAAVVNYTAEGTHEEGGVRWSARPADADPDGPVHWEGGNAKAPFSQHTLAIHRPGNPRPDLATVLQFHDWPDSGTADPDQLDRLFDAVDAELHRRGPHADAHPGLMVHCHFGVERTAVFCAMRAIREARRSGRPAAVEEIVAMLKAIRKEDAMKPFAVPGQLAMVLAYADRQGG